MVRGYGRTSGFELVFRIGFRVRLGFGSWLVLKDLGRVTSLLVVS